MADILPDSRLQDRRQFVPSVLGTWVPIFCASCGADGGLVPEDNMTFVCWLCAKCAETYGPILGMVSMPDEAFWKLVQEAQIEKYGRPLTAEEIALALGDPGSLESRLARDRAALTPRAGS